MSREAKLTKHSVSLALARCSTMQEAADLLGVNRRTMYKAIERFSLSTRLQTRAEGTPEATPELMVQVIEPEPVPHDYVPGRIPMQFISMAEYRDRYLGDVGRKRH